MTRFKKAPWWRRLTERFFGAPVELVSALPIAECGDRLAAAMDSRTRLFGKRPVIGRVADTVLHARKRIAFRNSFQTSVTARLFEQDGRTYIDCRFAMDPLVMAVLGAVAALVAITAIPAALAYLAGLAAAAVDGGEAPPTALAIPPLMLLGLVLLLGLGRGAALGEREFLIAFIKQTIAADLAGSGDFTSRDHEIARYFIKRNHPDDPHIAIYRVYRPARGTTVFSAWIEGRWQREDDIGRQFWTGFDADVDEVSRAEALEAIRTRKR
jgi:hypothetical protein